MCVLLCLFAIPYIREKIDPSFLFLHITHFLWAHSFEPSGLDPSLSLSLSLMTPSYDLNQFSPMSLVEDGDDHHQAHLHPFTTLPNDHNTSPLPCPIFFNTPQLQIANDTDLHLIQHQTLHQQQEFIDHFLIQESSNFSASNTNDIAQGSLCDQQYTRNEEDQRGSGKWMSSKMRMRKMMNPDGIVSKKPRRSKQLVQDQQNQQASQASSNSDGVVRVCSDCNTTKTPLWRSGPCGPKTLCNACGIRQRKERRALAAAAAVTSGLIPAAALNKVRKEKESDVDRTVPFKKRCRFSAAAVAGINQKKKKKQLCFDDIVISLSKSSAFHRVFPQDEKDAAILLMALSCGLMCS